MTNEAPPPDEVEKAVTAFNFCISCIKDGCLWSTGSLDKPHITTKNLKDVMARIAALEAENKRLIESIVRSRRFIQGGLIVDTAFAKHIQLEDAAEILDSALAQTGEK